MRRCRIRAWLILVAALALALSIGPPAWSQQKGVMKVATESPLSSDQAKPNVGVAEFFRDPAKKTGIEVVGFAETERSQTEEKPSGQEDNERWTWDSGWCYRTLDCRGSIPQWTEGSYCRQAPLRCSFLGGGRCFNYSGKPGCQ